MLSKPVRFVLVLCSISFGSVWLTRPSVTQPDSEDPTLPPQTTPTDHICPDATAAYNTVTDGMAAPPFPHLGDKIINADIDILQAR